MSARPALCGGYRVSGIPTAIASYRIDCVGVAPTKRLQTALLDSNHVPLC
jgi:hypothetical protein